MATVAEKISPGIVSDGNGVSGNGHTAPLTRDELIEALYLEPGKAEIVDGRIVRFDMTGRKPSFAGDEIFFYLRQYVRATKPAGIAVGDGKAFLCSLPNRESFSPDAAYYEGPDSGVKFFSGSPRFAVEVRSENDAEAEMKSKRDDYFAAGTEVVWDVDILGGGEIVRKFTKMGGSQNPVAVFRRGETADAEPAVPGFTMPVDDLFE
ncbi:MAG: Uma2 family endonuclease [Fibrella sp.]|nr:Uma2 family endonuclease [Armatimonadota bacterium]